MTVKGQVKEIVQEIKRHFSHHKHHRDESSTSSHTLVSDDSSHTAHSDGHSRPGTPEGELSSHLGTPERGDCVPTTPERKRVLSTSSHKHSVFLKLRRRKSSILSTDPRSKTPEHEVFPDGSQPGTPEHSATLSNPGTPESSLFSHGIVRQRVPSTPTRKHNVLHKLRRGSSHFKSSSESHSPEKTEIPVIHHHNSLSKLREHVESYSSEKTVKPVVRHQSSSSKLHEDLDAFQPDVPGAEADREDAGTAAAEDGESTLGPLPIIITSPPMEKTDSHGDTLHSSKYEGGGDIIDHLDVQLECDPVPETEEKMTGEDTDSSVQVEDVQTQTDLDTVQSRVDAETQTSPDTLVAPISPEACDSSSVPEPAVVIDSDSALNSDGNDRKSVDDPVDPPVSQEACDSAVVPEPAAVIDSDSALSPDGNDRKSVDGPVDPPAPAVIDTLVAPICQEVCDSPSVSEPVAVIDSALNSDGNDRKGIDDAVDPPAPAVIDHDQDLPTKDVDEPTQSEMSSAKDNGDAEDQAQSTVDTSPSEETTLAQSVPSPIPEPVNTPPPAVVDKPTPASPASEPQPYPQARPASPAPTPAFNTSPYLPRLTAPTMFLPIPNVRTVFPFWSVLGWLAPWRIFFFFRSLFSPSSRPDVSHSLSSASLELASSHYHPQFYLTFPSPFLTASPLFTGNPKSHDSRSSLPR